MKRQTECFALGRQSNLDNILGDYVSIRKQFQIHLPYCRYLSWFSTVYTLSKHNFLMNGKYLILMEKHVCVYVCVVFGGEVHVYVPNTDLWVREGREGKNHEYEKKKKLITGIKHSIYRSILEMLL